ncbi:MAG: EAL domain-containing protein [Oscillospiraceae bacterium]
MGSSAQLANYYTYGEFICKAKSLIQASAPNEYAFVSLVLDKFKYINNLFGYETGDLVLQRLEQTFSGELQEGECFSRVHGAQFDFFVRTNSRVPLDERFLRLCDTGHVLAGVLPEHYHCCCNGGIVQIDNPQENLVSLLDKASFVRKQAEGGDISTFLYYDNKFASELEWSNIITRSMLPALKNKEFEMYLQPKVLIKTEEIVGAEALARWNSKQFGMIYPDRFIPVLEQNGFICQLDFYILEQACSFIKERIDEGMEPFSISVNFSKANMSDPGFADKVSELVSKFGIPSELIELEMTESMMSNGFQPLALVVNDLKSRGFKVSLDDFGSAYSSLNYLKNMPFDIIKIDKEFLNSTINTDKGRIIVAKMVELIKSMRMIPVVEGVETQEQAEFLGKLSCDIGQGFFYSRPIPVHEFKAFLEHKSILPKMEQELLSGQQSDISLLREIPKEFQMDNWDLFVLGQNIDMGLMKGYLDGEASIQYINDRALNYLGYSRLEFTEVFHNSVIAFTHPEDVPAVKALTEGLLKNGEPRQFQTRAIRKDGKVITLQGRASCVLDNKGRQVGIYAFQDVTKELENNISLLHSLAEKVTQLNRLVVSEQESREELRQSEERYRLIVEQSDDIVFEWNFTDDTISFGEKFERLFHRNSIQRHVTTNCDIRNTIHPDDREGFDKWIGNTFNKSGIRKGEFRIADINGDFVWIKIRSTAICDKSGKPVKAVGVFSNINQQKEEMDKLLQKAQIDPLTHFLNKEELQNQVENQLKFFPGQSAAFFIIDIDDFKGVNDNLGHQAGDTVLQSVTQKIRKVFRESDIVGRMGGDEFAIFMKNVDDSEIIRQKAAELNKILHKTYFGELRKHTISVSVGVACYPQQAKCYNQLYKMSDAALYESKRRGKNCFTIYNDNILIAEEVIRTPFDNTARFLNPYFTGDLPFNIFEMLYETRDIQTSINMILSLLGKNLNIDRVYIFESSEDGSLISETFEWCATGMASIKEMNQDVPVESIRALFPTCNQEGILCYDDVSSMNEDIKKLLEPKQIKAMLHCAIYRDGCSIGFTGFDACQKKREWSSEEIAVLGYVSRILSVFLVQYNTTRELAQSNNNYRDMLETLNGYVYVVDAKTYELLYINGAVREHNATLGETCHAMAFGRDTPCENCPIKQLSPTTNFAKTEIYSQKLNHRVTATASKLKWNGKRNAVLVCCTDVSSDKEPAE